MTESLMFIGNVLLRSIISIVVLFILTKLMGAKQISQLTFFDYAIGISIGSIAADIAADIESSYLDAVISMGIYAGVAIIISYITKKSMKARRLLTGTPTILIDKGHILKQNLSKSKFDINELLCECRVSGYFNIADLEYAIMEPNGRISFIPKAAKKPVTAEDLNLTPSQEKLVANVIIDGNIMSKNLKAMGKNEDWLLHHLKQQNIKNKDDIILATLDDDNNLSVYLEGQKQKKLQIMD